MCFLAVHCQSFAVAETPVSLAPYFRRILETVAVAVTAGTVPGRFAVVVAAVVVAVEPVAAAEQPAPVVAVLDSVSSPF